MSDPVPLAAIYDASADGRSLVSAANFAAMRGLLELATYYAAIGHNHSGVYSPVGHTHTQSDVTGLVSDLAGKVDSSSLSESIDDRVAALLVAGTNITLTYNDASNTLTIASTGGGGIGGSTGATDNRLLRADGTGGATAQNSAVTVDDSGNVSGLGTVGCGAITSTGTSQIAQLGIGTGSPISAISNTTAAIASANAPSHATGTSSIVWSISASDKFVAAFRNNHSDYGDGVLIVGAGDKNVSRKLLQCENVDGTQVFAVRGDGSVTVRASLTSASYTLGSDLALVPIGGSQSAVSAYHGLQLLGVRLGSFNATPSSVGTADQYGVSIPVQAAAAVGLMIKGAASQTANLFEVQNSSGTFLVGLLANGSLRIASGTGARAGNATLVAGTVTVTNTTVTANTIVYLTAKTAGGTIGTLTYTLSAGASFTINSSSASDTSLISYLLIEVN